MQTLLVSELISLTVSVGMFLAVGWWVDRTWYHQRRDDAAAWKLQPDRWPTPEQRRRALWLGMGNIAMCAVIGGAVSAWIATGGWSTLSFDPLAHGVLWLPLAVVVDIALLDFGLYWAHRMLHHPRIYRRVHLVHHRFKAPFLHTYTAVHPAEQLLYVAVTLVPLATVPQFYGSYLIALGYTWFIGMVDHAGVKAHLGLPGHPSNRFHDDHHVYVRCNFGHHTHYWDLLYGTARLRQAQRDAAVSPSAVAGGTS